MISVWPLIGGMAATLTMFGFVPQIVKVVKHKSAKDVSVITILQFLVGVSFWMVYGLYLQDYIIIVANAVTLLTLIVLLFLYFSYGRTR